MRKIATYSVSNTGEITVSQGGNPVSYGYLVSPTKMFLISLDDNPRTSIETRSSAPRHR